jgi:hypothetical protein
MAEEYPHHLDSPIKHFPRNEDNIGTSITVENRGKGGPGS